jgi:hypothetical protein
MLVPVSIAVEQGLTTVVQQADIVMGAAEVAAQGEILALPEADRAAATQRWQALVLRFEAGKQILVDVIGLVHAGKSADIPGAIAAVVAAVRDAVAFADTLAAAHAPKGLTVAATGARAQAHTGLAKLEAMVP